MKKILITGGMGFIGTNLTNKLLSLGYHVISIDNFFSSKRKIINHNNFTFIEHDIINKIPNIDCDFIYHLACPASPKQYLKDTIYTLDINYIGTKNVLDFAKNKKIPIPESNNVPMRTHLILSKFNPDNGRIEDKAP